MQNYKNFAARILPLIDLTSLNDNDTPAIVEKLCNAAKTYHGSVAAVCVYPQFVQLAYQILGHNEIKIATVANFPTGNQPINLVLQTIQQALKDGANEIDLVIPYQQYMQGDHVSTKRIIELSKNACQNQAILKVILETGVLAIPEIINSACEEAIYAGANFLKTSTGKVPIGATLEAAEVMLNAIKRARSRNISVGFKASGGIKTMEQAIQYLNVADTILGNSWATPQTMRFGASSLLNDVLTNIF